MDTRLLDVFHNSANKKLITVIKCINIDLDCVIEKAIYQQRVVAVDYNIVPISFKI